MHQLTRQFSFIAPNLLSFASSFQILRLILALFTRHPLAQPPLISPTTRLQIERNNGGAHLLLVLFFPRFSASLFHARSRRITYIQFAEGSSATSDTLYYERIKSSRVFNCSRSLVKRCTYMSSLRLCT